jgi:hypothetical protein
MDSEKRNRIGLTILIVVLCVIAGCVGLIIALYALGFIKVISSVSSGDDVPKLQNRNISHQKASSHQPP